MMYKLAMISAHARTHSDQGLIEKPKKVQEKGDEYDKAAGKKE